MSDVTVDVWLYGILARHGGPADKGSFANLQVVLKEGSTVRDLLMLLKMQTEERGISFINGQLSAMSGLQPDLGHVLCDTDRVAFFDLRSMWPFQYRHGVSMIGEMADAMRTSEDGGLHHTYEKKT